MFSAGVPVPNPCDNSNDSFLESEIDTAMTGIPQNIIPQVMTEWKYEKYAILKDSSDRRGLMANVEAETCS